MSSTFAGEPFNSATIQKMLDENTQLIKAVMDHQNQGEVKKCAQYQQILHRNLVFLATVADSNMNVQSSMQNPAGQQLQPQGSMSGNVNNIVGFRPQNIQGGMPAVMQLPNMTGSNPNVGGNMPGLQGNLSNMQGSMGNIANNMQNVPTLQAALPNIQKNMQMQGNLPGLQVGIQNMPNSMSNMPNNISNSMQNMPNISNMAVSMTGSMPMQSGDMMPTMQQGMPNMTVSSSQNEMPNSMMMHQRQGIQSIQNMQFGSNMQPNQGGF